MASRFISPVFRAHSRSSATPENMLWAFQPVCSVCCVLIVFLLFEMHIFNSCRVLCSGEQAQNDRSANEYEQLTGEIDEIDENESNGEFLINPAH